MLDKNRIPLKARAPGLPRQKVHALVAEEEDRSLCEILENGMRNGLSLERENVRTVLEELKAFGVVRPAPVRDSERCCCMEVT